MIVLRYGTLTAKFRLMKKLISIVAAMIVGTALFAQKATEAVPDSQLRKQYASEENNKRIQAIQLIKEEAGKNKVLSSEPEKLESVEKAAPSLPESSGKSELADPKKAKKHSGHKFGPGVTKISGDDKVASIGVSPMRMLAAVIILILAMAAFFFILKKFSGKITGSDNNASLKVKARLQLDNKNSVVIVGAYEQEFMLGIGSNGVNLISKFAPIDIGEAEEEADVKLELNNGSIVEKDDTSKDSKTSFEKRLKMAVGAVDSEDLTSVGDKK